MTAFFLFTFFYHMLFQKSSLGENRLNVPLTTPRKSSTTAMIPPGGSHGKLQLSYPVDPHTEPSQYRQGEIVLYKKGEARRLGRVDFTNVSDVFRNQVISNFTQKNFVYLASSSFFIFLGIPFFVYCAKCIF